MSEGMVAKKDLCEAFGRSHIIAGNEFLSRILLDVSIHSRWWRYGMRLLAHLTKLTQLV